MVAYGIAKARAMANRTDWNERTEITKAVITWFDADYEYELEIENEDRMDNEEFTVKLSIILDTFPTRIMKRSVRRQPLRRIFAALQQEEARQWTSRSCGCSSNS